MNTTAINSTPAAPVVSKDDTRVIIACALSSVAMVCIVAAMLYFRATVLRREQALTELQRPRTLTEKAKLRSNSSSSGKDGNCRAVPTTSSTVVLGVRRSRPGSGSLTRHQSYPPDPGKELRRGSLHTIPNGFGARATVEPQVIRTTAKLGRASSLSDYVPPPPKKIGPATRRASWSFDNPVYDQWVPPLMKSTDKEELIDRDVLLDDDDSIFTVDPDVSIDGISLTDIEKEVEEESTKDGTSRWLKSPRLSAFAFGNPLYGQNGDQHSMPTLHEREDSASSGSSEKTAEKETTRGDTCAITKDSESLGISRQTAESYC